MKVVANIQNNSGREIKPKYTVYKKNSFFASGKRRVDTRDAFKEVGDPIPPNTNEIVTRFITIPHDVEASIHNCSIITAEHRLRVRSFDQEICVLVLMKIHSLKVVGVSGIQKNFSKKSKLLKCHSYLTSMGSSEHE